MREVVAVAYVSRASELYTVRHVLDTRLAEYSITGDEAEAIIALVNELLWVAIAMDAGTLNVTVELDVDVAANLDPRRGRLGERHERETEAASHSTPSPSPSSANSPHRGACRATAHEIRLGRADY